MMAYAHRTHADPLAALLRRLAMCRPQKNLIKGATVTTTHCLIRESDGLCHAGERMMERDGDDIIVYGHGGYPTRFAVAPETAEIKGWGQNESDSRRGRRR